MRGALLILNPAAGAFRARPTLLTALRGHEALAGVEIALSSSAEETRTLARQAREEGRERLLVAGGDGTLHHAVNGLLDGVAPDDLPDPGLPVFAPLPMGTGNDLARALGSPLDPWKALDALDPARVRALDLIHVEGVEDRWCLNAVTGGMATPEADPDDDNPKGGLGVLAYWKRGAEALGGEHPDYELRLTLDDGDEEVLQAQNLVVANGRFVAGGLPVAPRAVLDDGLLDVVVVPALALTEMGALFPRLLLGTHLDHEALLFRRARSVRFTSTPALALSLDGERADAGEARLTVVAGALPTAVGRAAGARALVEG